MPGLPASIIKRYGVTKKAWSVFRGRHRRSGSARVHKTRSVRTRMVRRYGRRHRGGGKSLMRGVEGIAKAGALIAPAVYDITKSSTPMASLVYDYTGYAMDKGTWDWRGLIHGWGPVVGVTVGLKAYHKLVGLLRRV